MSSLSESRVSTPISPITPRKRNSISTAFKSVGRDTKASWGYRIYKDVNNLSYNVNYDLIKGKGDLKNKPSFKRNGKNNISLSSSSKKDLRPDTSPTNSNFQKTLNVQALMKDNKVKNPE